MLSFLFGLLLQVCCLATATATLPVRKNYQCCRHDSCLSKLRHARRVEQLQ